MKDNITARTIVVQRMNHREAADAPKASNFEKSSAGARFMAQS